MQMYANKSVDYRRDNATRIAISKAIYDVAIWGLKQTILKFAGVRITSRENSTRIAKRLVEKWRSAGRRRANKSAPKTGKRRKIHEQWKFHQLRQPNVCR